MPESNRLDTMLKALLITISVFVFGMLMSNESIRLSLMHPFSAL